MRSGRTVSQTCNAFGAKTIQPLPNGLLTNGERNSDRPDVLTFNNNPLNDYLSTVRCQSCILVNVRSSSSGSAKVA
jgi:hypothetical protein